MHDDSMSEGEDATFASPKRMALIKQKPSRFGKCLNLFCTQRAALTILTTALMILFTVFTVVPVGFNLAKAPNYFGNLTQPLSLLFFCFFHAWLNLGILQAIGFVIFSTLISFSLEELASVTAIPFGMLRYDSVKYNNIMISNIPVEVPFSYFFLLYLAFVLSEIIVQGYKRSRTQHQTRIRKSLYQQCMIPVVASLICLGFHMVLEPIGNNANLWNYVSSDGNVTSDVELIYFGVPIFSFLGWYLTCFFIFSLYLLYESLLDRFLFFLHQRYEDYQESKVNTILQVLQPPLSESGPFLHYISLLLPIGTIMIFGMPYLLVVDPPMLRVVAFVTFYVPCIFAISRFRYKNKNGRYQSIN